MKYLRHYFTIAILCLTALAAIAQKLPNVQNVALWAPAAIKIDGKAAEWNKFAAHNNATDIYYTLSNDDENLYFTVQAKYNDVCDKILRGGITLTINHTLAKKDAQKVAITYPFVRGDDESAVSNMLARKAIEKRDAKNAVIEVTDMNEVLGKRSKSIKVIGMKEISDESISVYNQDGIKAASAFDKDLVYTQEQAIPLKYLMLPANAAFSYNVKINPPDETPGPHGDGPPPPPMAVTSTAATDFWGVYTLAKK